MLQDETGSAAVRAALNQIMESDSGARAYERNDYASALRHFRRAAKSPNDPNRFAYYLRIAQCLFYLGRPDEAEQALRDAGECAAKSERSLPSAVGLMFGLDSLLAGEFDTARMAYEVVVRLGDPKVAPHAALNLGNLHYSHGGSADEALRHWEFALDRGPARIKVRAAHNIGWLWERRGDLRRARRYYRRAFLPPWSSPKNTLKALRRLAASYRLIR